MIQATIALGLLKRFSGPLMIVALVALGGLLLKAGLDNMGLKRQITKAEARAEDERTKRIKAENELATLYRDYNEQARAGAEREKARVAEQQTIIERQRGDYAKREATREHALRLALDGLRYTGAAGENDRRALRPAADAPAACAGYAADPTRLPLPSAEFLVREADRADRVVLQLDACQRYVTEVVQPK
jgi:hypothetical protein